MPYNRPLSLRTLSSALFASIFVFIVFWGCSSTTKEVAGSPASDLDIKLATSLERAGENSDEIQAFLDAYPEGEKNTAARFLVANLPMPDLASMTCKELKEHVDCAFRVRQSLPWGGTPPFNLFLHYVLPHRVTQETHQPWRAAFSARLEPMVKPLDNMADAALAVNRWCAQRARFVQTEFRDQSPLDTLKSGYGRCEELMCITICALRSVGIPARPCSTPWWVVNDNNHAWVEVWADGSWYYLGGCEGTDALNRTWFRGTTKRAGAVVSTMFGAPDPGFETGERIYRALDKSALINSTSVYSSTCRINVTVNDADNLPVNDCPVAVSVFNYGGLRPLIGGTTNEQGLASIYTGMGEFFISAGTDEGKAYAIAKTEPEGTIDVNITLKPDALPEPGFWLRYPTVAEAERMAALRTDRVPEKKVKNKLELTDPHPLKKYEEGSDPAAEAQIDLMPDPAAFRAILEDAGANWKNLLAPVATLPEAQRPGMLEFLKRTSHLDRVELTPAMIKDHVSAAETNRPADLDDDVYYDYVLKAGIYLEHLDAWRSMLAKQFADCKADTRDATVQAVNTKIAATVQELDSKDRLAPMMNPLQVMHSGWATDMEAAIFAVGALRSLGIPARKVAHKSKAEYFNAGTWTSFDPLFPDGREEADNEADKAAGAEASASVRLSLYREGVAVTDFKGYGIATFRKGAWFPLRNVASKVEGDEILLTVPPGEYLVTAGVRNANGDPWVQTQGMQLEPGATATCSWKIDLPENSGIFKFPKVRELEAIPQLQTQSVEGEEMTLEEMVNEHPMLFVFFLNDHEPSMRILPLVANAHADLEAAGVVTQGICLPPEKDKRCMPPAIEGLPFGIRKGHWMVGTAFNLPLTEEGNAFANLPSVLLLNRGGKVLLWVEGYDLKIEELLKAAARVVR